MNESRDAYAVLQVRPDADFAVLQAAYRALARRYHAEGSSPDQARMVEINRAWESLRTLERRARYDQERRRIAVPVRPQPTAETHTQPYDPWRYGSPPSRTGGEVIDFGRYAGWRIADLVRHDPDYLRWLSRHSSGVRFIETIARYLPEAGLGRRAGAIG
ncbi:MAG: DnaJ domain-containing protein [Chloroflexota bacterium]|nr:DnaJ domain-containing protein [Chloroflexota bacterium]